MEQRKANPRQPAETLALLERLSSKPGVRSTLIISRSTGAIVQSSGFSKPEQSTAPDGDDDGQYGSQNLSTADGDENTAAHSADRVAKAVFAFVKAADSCALDLSNEDDIRLLRLRLKRQELVIVPSKSL